jgi:hypothetical protein
MRNDDWSLVIMTAGIVAIILLAAFAAQKNWLRPGPISTIVYALAGAVPILMMRAKNVPPDWFSGGKIGFGLGLSMMASAFLFRSASERTFRVPFLFSFGATLVVLNVLPHL